MMAKRHKIHYLSEKELKKLYPGNLINIHGTQICTVCGAIREASFFRNNQGERWMKDGFLVPFCDGVNNGRTKGGIHW